MDKKLVFFSTMCLLDNTSGAAISVRSFLEAVAASGIPCETFTASLFDPQREVNLRGILGPKSADPSSLGKIFVVEKAGVKHNVFLAKSTQSKKFTQEETQQYERAWVHWLKKHQPRVVVTYGGSPYTLKMQNYARRAGAQIIFYLGNAEYKTAKWHQPGDLVLCPSHFLAQHYKETVGVEPQVLRTIMNKERLDFDTVDDPQILHQRWKTGFVTFMTPIPHKGLTLFHGIARVAGRLRPDLKFLVTEGRSDRDKLAQMGFDLSHMSNVWLMASHDDVRSIFQRTKILLVPSFWKEGFARSVLEAQLCGIPVLSSTRGGLPEALNGGGYLFDVPEACVESHLAMPDKETVMDWWEIIERLIDDEDEYNQASMRARQSATPFHPDVTAEAAVRYFSGVIDEKYRQQ